MEDEMKQGWDDAIVGSTFTSDEDEIPKEGSDKALRMLIESAIRDHSLCGNDAHELELLRRYSIYNKIKCFDDKECDRNDDGDERTKLRLSKKMIAKQIRSQSCSYDDDCLKNLSNRKIDGKVPENQDGVLWSCMSSIDDGDDMDDATFKDNDRETARYTTVQGIVEDLALAVETTAFRNGQNEAMMESDEYAFNSMGALLTSSILSKDLLTSFEWNRARSLLRLLMMSLS